MFLLVGCFLWSFVVFLFVGWFVVLGVGLFFCGHPGILINLFQKMLTGCSFPALKSTF